MDQYIYSIPYGKNRRQAIIKELSANTAMYPTIPGLPINNKWLIQLKRDPDLKKLIKKGILKKIRCGGRFMKTKKFSDKRQSYLQISRLD